MSRKKDENYFYEDEDADEDAEEDAEEDVKCPPQQVPSSNLNEECASRKPVTSHKHKRHHKHERHKHKHEKQTSIESSKRHTGLQHLEQKDFPSSNLNEEEWASHKPATSHTHKRHRHHKNERHKHKHEKQTSMEISRRHTRLQHMEQKDFPSSNLNEEWASHRPATRHTYNKRHRHHKYEHQNEIAVAMEEGVPFEENEKIEAANNPQNLLAEEGIGYRDTSGGQHVVSPSRRPDVDPGAEAPGTVEHYPTEGRCSNLNEERASQKDVETFTMEEGVPLEEKEKMEEATYPQNLVDEEGIGIEYPDTSEGQHVVSHSRSPDVGPGAEAMGTRVPHPTEGRRSQIPERVFPGAFREGGLENEEGDDEDELTSQSHTEPSIPPTLTAELVNPEEEERRRQDDINLALQRALAKEHQKAVVAEVISDRDRRWKFAGAFLLLALIVVGVVLGVTLPPEPDTDLIDLLSSASFDGGEALRNSSTPQYKALKWLAGDRIFENYPDQEKIQRYALATLYYSTKGEDTWTREDFWLTDEDVCDKWYQYQDITINCTSAGAVSSLSLYNNSLVGTIPPEIGLLSSLTVLNLDTNLLSGMVPTSIGTFTDLYWLDLGGNNLRGTIPTELGLLSNLELLSLDSNGFTGALPNEIASLTKLTSLNLSTNILSGTLPSFIGLLTNLQYFGLSGNDFTGTIPTEIVLLTKLRPIDAFQILLLSVSEVGLEDPNSPQYQALKWIANEDPANTTVGITDTETIRQRYVAAVLYFALGGEGWSNKCNFLSGDDICLWNKNNSGISCGSMLIKSLRLPDNWLVGSIPEEIGYFSDLTTIEMTNSAITGKLPSSLANLNLLTKLHLTSNGLTGPDLTNNGLTGSDLTNNGLTGTIPDFIYIHAQLTQVHLEYNNLTGTIHPSLGNSPRLEEFQVYGNKLTGPIPAAVGQSSVLRSVNLSGNSLTGTIPEFSPTSRISAIGLADNKLVGPIPDSIGKLLSLQILNAGKNKLTGTIPDLSGNTLLQSLRLQLNKIRGSIPTEVGMLTAMTEALLLNDNQLTGTIPSEIGRLTKLTENLQLNDNNFTGTLPSTVGSLVSLEHMLFENNMLEGPIPTELGQCQNLTTLDLGHNHFSGTVPTSIGTLTNLDFLGLSTNYLINGTIPSELGLLSNLSRLFLDSNRFTGTVPASLASLPLLKYLQLFDNDLTGSLEAFCVIDFDALVANACGQDEIECRCCTLCCVPNQTGLCYEL